MPELMESTAQTLKGNPGRIKLSDRAAKLWRVFRDRPIQMRLSVALNLTVLLSTAGLISTVFIIAQTLRDQLRNQAISELTTLGINYNIRLNQQIRSDLGGRVNETIILETIKNEKASLDSKAAMQTAAGNDPRDPRNIDFVGLVSLKKKYLEGNYGQRYGEEYDPAGVVSKALELDVDATSNELLSLRELEKDNFVLASKIQEDFGDKKLNVLVSYTARPVKNENSNTVGAIVFANVVELKTDVAVRTNESLRGGLSAVALLDGSLSIGSALVDGKEIPIQATPELTNFIQTTKLTPNSQNIDLWNQRGRANNSPVPPNTIITQEIGIGGKQYTLAAAPILNAKDEVIAILIRGAAHDALNQLLVSTTGFVVAVGLVSVGVGAVLAQVVGKTVTIPIKSLEKVAQEYAAGDLTERAQIDSQDEVGTLGLLFNQMAENIAQRQTEIMSAKESVDHQNQVLEQEVEHLLEVVSEFEAGDLTVQAQVSDQATGLIADTLNQLAEQLASVLANVLRTAQQVANGAESLEKVAIAVADNAQQQVRLVSRASSGMESVNQLAQGAADQAVTADQAVQSSQQAVVMGQNEVTNLTASIDSLKKGTEQMVTRIKSLDEFVSLAKQFVQDQKRLVSLTQVLSMNASMVAARAVEQKDPDQFASVAREFEAIASQVSSLASQTSQGLTLLQQRTGFIEVVVSGIDQDVSDVDRLVNQFTEGVDQSSKAFSNIKRVTAQVARVGQAVTESSQEIARSILESTNSIREIEQVAQQSAQQARITRERSTEMGNLARRLLQDVQFFRLPEQYSVEAQAVEVPDSEIPALSAAV
ncbi:MAG: HAMP domain-containing protein [Pseudanabaenaceae cyanobacterium bins.68]|nr:HAMP domain-containing protein [Pseudanabaenaceae cyanobacterium bins.68]